MCCVNRKYLRLRVPTVRVCVCFVLVHRSEKKDGDAPVTQKQTNGLSSLSFVVPFLRTHSTPISAPGGDGQKEKK